MLETGLDDPVGLTVDGTTIYWTIAGKRDSCTGTVMKLTLK